MTQNLTDLLRKFADDVRPHVEGCGQVSVTIRKDKSVSIDIHGCADYSHGLRMMKGMGAKLDRTTYFDPHAPWSALYCTLGDVEIKFYCGGLPPTCEIVTKTVSVPKTQTVDTGDMIEITTQEFRCLNADGAA